MMVQNNLRTWVKLLAFFYNDGGTIVSAESADSEFAIVTTHGAHIQKIKIYDPELIMKWVQIYPEITRLVAEELLEIGNKRLDFSELFCNYLVTYLDTYESEEFKKLLVKLTAVNRPINGGHFVKCFAKPEVSFVANKHSDLISPADC